MQFNSLSYLILLTTTGVLFFNLPALPRLILLLTASMIFYAFWSVPLLTLILIQAGVDFAAALLIQRSEKLWQRRLFLFASLGMNLGLLAYFKYSNFFVDSVTTMLGNPSAEKYLDIVLPPGISFYTFQSMSYTIDVYRRQITPTASFFRYFSYVMFFPQLVAGPIERASHLLTQLDHASRARFSIDNVVTGLRMIAIGMFKKVVIADYCARVAEPVFAAPGAYTGWSTLIATYAFTLQIYCDFSAYSEMARGSARIFGVDLMQNFDQPYLTGNISAFWRRWHISLSTWIRDYIYLPLGGNRKGRIRTLFNLVVTMFLSGLWHGAAWNFVLWGLYHGFLLLVHTVTSRTSVWKSLQSRAGAAWAPVCWFVTFHFVVLGWVMFRAGSVADMRVLFANIAAAFVQWPAWAPAQVAFVAFTALFVAASYGVRRFDVIGRIDRDAGASTVFYAVLVVCILLLGQDNGPQFIYFQF